MVSRKIIKKLVQLTVILLLMMFAVPATAYLLLQSNKIQNRVTHKIMQAVSDKLDAHFTISSVDIAFLYRIRLNDVYLQDLSGDTLIYVKRLTAGIRTVNPVRKIVSIGSVNLDKAFVALAIDSTYELNLNYILDKLKGDGTGKGGWEVKFNNIRLQDSRFGLKNYYYKPTDYGMNFSDISAYHIDADLRLFRPSKDSLSFHVKSLRLREKSGLVLEKLSCNFSQHRTFLSFRNITLKTRDSEIKGNDITMRFKDYSDFKGKTFAGNVKFRVDLDNTQLDFADIGYFTPVFRNLHQKVIISGLVTGPVNNIRASRLDIRFGNNSRFQGDLQLEGLPDIKQTFILADIKQLSSSYADIQLLGRFSGNGIRLPEQLKKLGETTYTGNFTGFINDFVAYGKFDTELGIINTDILFRPDSSSILDFQGKLNIQDFNLGVLMDATDKIGNISLTASIDGATVAGKSIDATLKGIVERFEFMKYEYSNISLSGNLNNKTFNGSVNVEDPNIDLEFFGKVDFSDSIPVFDFSANITEANFYALHISHSYPDLRASFYIIANAQGKSINSLNGEIKLLNSLFTKKDMQLQIYDLSIVSESKAGYSLLQLRSDFLDADLYGNYELTKSGTTLKQFIGNYLPSLLDSSEIMHKSPHHSITLAATIKNIRPIFDFFAPDYGMAENSTLNMSYRPEGQIMHIQLQAPYIVAKSLVWNKVNIIIDGNKEVLDFEAGSENLIVANRIKLENFTALSTASSDTAGIGFRWNNWDELQYRGNINALASITKETGRKQPHFEITIRPSGFITNDTLWTLKPGLISIDSTAVKFNNITVAHKNEYFRINGALSEQPADILNIVFNRLNIANLNGVTSPSGFNLGGVLNGNATLSNMYSRPLFTSFLKIDSLIINNEMLGNMEVNSSWDDRKKAVLIDAYALRNNLKTINLEGTYTPAGQGKLDFNLELEKLRLNLFNPYIKSIFTDIRGIASGKATLKGTLSKPVLNGKFDLQKTSFTLNYLQTRYSFSDKAEIDNNNFYFENIKINDPKGNSAYLNGAIRSRYLKDFYLDMTINSRDFLSLNTTQADNKQFYGTAYATGVIKITGTPKNLFMDITATTNKNTSIKIPLSSLGELDKYPFINIKYPASEDRDEIEKTEYQVDLSGIQIRFKLIVTPDAEVQIIIDPQLGEIIKGRGTGNLDMRINTSGDFIITGDYVIEEGEYLFTLQKFINKKLTIEPGGILRWNGDPLDATINITANYPVRASLSDLLGTDDTQKILVYDRVIMTGKLMSPDIKYDIYLPNADEATRLKVSGAMPTSEEQSRQFISLLMNKRFFLNPERRTQYSAGSSSSSYSSAAGANFSELLSNQLSNWLSQIVNDLDVDVNYRSNREMNSEDIQMVVTYPLFNDRLIINGSLEATNATTNASDELVGEFDIDYKLTKNGKLRLKTYNHANNEFLYEEQSAYTQGLGLTYKEEFNTFGELLRRLFGKKEESPEPVKADETDTVVNNLE